MKKAIVSASTFISAFISFVPIAHAATIVDCPPGGQFSKLCNLTTGEFGKRFGDLITFAFVIAIVIALAFLIWGGVKWITSGGEKTGVEEARNHVVAAVIGLIIVFLSFFILNLIVYFFTGVGLTQITIPTL